MKGPALTASQQVNSNNADANYANNDDGAKDANSDDDATDANNDDNSMPSRRRRDVGL
jgi:hypothetical protein